MSDLTKFLFAFSKVNNLPILAGCLLPAAGQVQPGSDCLNPRQQLFLILTKAKSHLSAVSAVSTSISMEMDSSSAKIRKFSFKTVTTWIQLLWKL